MSASSPTEVHARLAEAFSAGDMSAFLALHEPESTQVVPPDRRHVTGTEEIRRAVEPFLSMRPKFESEVVGVLESDGLAMTHALWRLEGTDRDGKPVTLAGLGTVVSRRQPDGSWRIVLDNPLSP